MIIVQPNWAQYRQESEWGLGELHVGKEAKSEDVGSNITEDELLCMYVDYHVMPTPTRKRSSPPMGYVILV